MPNPLAVEQDLFGGPVPADYLPVAPSDSVDLTGRTIGLYIEGAGDIAVQMRAGVTRTIAVPANHTFWGTVSRVLSTNTTATGIFQLII